MKNAILFTLALLLAIHSCCQSKLGDVASVSITSPNLDSSLAVYEKLGFQKIASNDFPFPWLQVSDGSLLITIRKDDTPYIGLSYYSDHVDEIAAQLEKDSIVFEKKPVPGDALKRYYIKSPDGFMIVLCNNPGGFTQPAGITLLTMKREDYQSPDKYPNKQCGAFGEFCHPVTDIKQSVTFWKRLGFTVKTRMNAPYQYAILSDGLMLIGLHQTKTFSYPAITYFGLNVAARLQSLKEQGLSNFSEMAGKDNQVLKTWEGQHFFLFAMGM